MKLLEGLSEDVYRTLLKNYQLQKAQNDLIDTLHYYGYKTAILSGGFTYFGHYLTRKIRDIDFVYANQLEIKDGKLTGNYLGDIVNGNKKAEYLRETS